MAPGKPVKPIKIRVARHNAQKMGMKLNHEVESQARSQNIRTDTYQSNSESAAALAQAVVRLVIPCSSQILSSFPLRKAPRNGTRC
jgi:hypothetical protein